MRLLLQRNMRDIKSDDADFVETPGGEYYLVELEKGELEVKVKVNAEGEFI